MVRTQSIALISKQVILFKIKDEISKNEWSVLVCFGSANLTCIYDQSHSINKVKLAKSN